VRWSVALAVHSTLGLLQAHHPWLTLVHVLSNVHSRKCVMQCVMLNVLLFRGALHVYEKVLPRLCVSLLGVHLLGDWKYELAIVVLWAVPAYVICEIVSTTLLFKMAKQMATATPPPPPPPRAGGGGGAAAGVTGGEEAGGMVSFTSIVYTRLIYIVFVLQIRLICGVPFIGPMLALVLSALLHSYDSFEFIWEHQGYGVAARFELIESHWLYFLGYGGVLAWLSMRLRFWDLFALRTVLYPIYIANAPYARFESRKASRSLPVFKLPLLFFNSLIQLTAASIAPDK